MTPGAVVKQAKDIACSILSVSRAERVARLRILKESDEVLYALVKAAMDEQRDSCQL